MSRWRWCLSPWLRHFDTRHCGVWLREYTDTDLCAYLHCAPDTVRRLRGAPAPSLPEFHRDVTKLARRLGVDRAPVAALLLEVLPIGLPRPPVPLLEDEAADAIYFVG